MTDDDARPTTNQPLNARPRPKVWPAVAVAGLFLVILVVFLLLTTVQQNS
ncbi:MAG TPA: hypothetical protein VD864_14500 [Nocardioides sp.]|nr:hypothetical protein [Nocardioides sp.]